MILPQLEQGPLFAAVNFSLAVEAPQNTTVIQSTLAAYLCPSDPTSGPFQVTDARRSRCPRHSGTCGDRGPVELCGMCRGRRDRHGHGD